MRIFPLRSDAIRAVVELKPVTLSERPEAVGVSFELAHQLKARAQLTGILTAES